MPRALPLTGRTVIVTGASMGIGKELSLTFAQAGATVVAAARSAGALQELARSTVAGQILPIVADVTDDGAVEAMIETALRETGRIDILINNAGIGVNGSVEEVDLPNWRKALEVNLLGPVRCIQRVLPIMRRQGGGQIIQISSVAGLVSVPYIGAYSATKFGLNAISDALRIEVAPDGIDVISVYPGSTESNFRENALGERKWAKVRPRRVSAQRVADRVLRASLRRERDVYVTWLDRLICWYGERFPRISDLVLVKAFKLKRK